VGDGLLKGSFGATQLGNMMQRIGGRGLVSAFINTSINGGSFGQAFMNSVAGDMGAIGANAMGLYTDAYTLPNVLGHAAIGCLAAAIASRDCVSGAIGAAASALITPAARDALYSGENNLEQVPGADGTLLMRETYSDPVKNAMVTGMSMLSGSMAAGLTGRDAGTAADAARNEALNNALSPKLKELANAGPNCKAGDCVQYVEALKTEKVRTQLEYDACMRAADCTAARAADLGSDLLRLQTTYEQTVRRGIYVGDLNWNGTGNPVPADYFDGLTGLGAIGTGAALRGNALRAGERPEGIASGARAESSVNGVKLNNQLTSQAITDGHAFGKHIGEFSNLGISTEAQFQAHVEYVINNATNKGLLNNGRSYFYDANSNTIVVKNPNAVDGGTAFRIDTTRYPNPLDYIKTLR